MNLVLTLPSSYFNTALKHENPRYKCTVIMLNLRLIKKFPRHLLIQSKCLCSAKKPMVNMAVDDDGIAVLTLQKHPVNSLCIELLNQTADALEGASKNEYKGVVLTSAIPAIFSAGLDLKVIHSSDMKRLKELHEGICRVTWQLLTSDFVTANAINGFTAAGGCLMSVLTDYRIIVDGQYTIGFNDTAIGIVPASWIVKAMASVMGARRAMLAVTSSQLFQPREALEAGLVDDIAADKDEAIEKCKQFIKQHDQIPPLVRGINKRTLRESIIKLWTEGNQENNMETLLEQYMDEDLQSRIGATLESLKNKKKKSR